MSQNLDALVQTIARLRGKDGCPWDKEQTHKTLARYLMEESYEVLEAIHEGDQQALCEELGDLLLQVVLNAQVAKDNGGFDIEDVAKKINSKMIERHPHVFANATAGDAKAVLEQWHELKDKKRPQSGSLLSDISKTLPALLQALKVSEKAVNLGFEWNTEDEIWQQLVSELAELKQALAAWEKAGRLRQSKTRQDVELECGDVLFTMVNLARWHDINAEEALILAIEKFKKRFSKMEELTEKPLKKLTKEEYAELWERAKAVLSDLALLE